MKQYVTWLAIAFCLALVAIVAFVNVVSIADAFGEGPPYYGSTTNMDKWINPLPLLGAIDAAVAATLFFAGRQIRKHYRARGGSEREGDGGNRRPPGRHAPH